MRHEAGQGLISKAGHTRGVIVAHPGTQHSYETALAVLKAGLLKAYLTSFYCEPRSALWRVMRLAGVPETQLGRRCRDGLASELVRQYRFGELFYLGGARLGLWERHAARVVRWRNERFDRFVARAVERERPSAVICYDTCALHAFESAEGARALSILDQSVGHWQTLIELMREEAEAQPDFADSLPLDAPEWWLACRAEEALRADLILAGSEYVKQTMLRHGVDPARVAIVPYGADVERFQSGGRSEDGGCRLLFVGQLSQRKGIKYLLEAVTELRATGIELVMVGGVVGSGSGLARYREHFKHVPNVPHREVHRYFEQADIFVYPSLHEGSALAIYEALAAGLPVITTPNSGSVVRDGVEGFIVPIRDVEALQEKILLLWHDRELRRAMGERARKRAEEFTWAAYRRNLGAMLRKLLGVAAEV